MNIQHTYIVDNIVKKLQQDQFQNVVFKITYTLKSIDQDNPGPLDTFTQRTIQLNLNAIDSETFIPYENLTEQIVISWLSEKSRDLELHHEKIMNNLVNPSLPEYVEELPPWVNGSGN